MGNNNGKEHQSASSAAPSSSSKRRGIYIYTAIPTAAGYFGRASQPTLFPSGLCIALFISQFSLVVVVVVRPSCPGVPAIVPRRGDALQQLAYTNKPEDAVVLQWAAPYTDGGTPVNGTPHYLLLESY